MTEADTPGWTHSILITGAAGFIGSHVCDEFVRTYTDCLIVGYDALDYCASMRNVESIANAPNFVFVHGDILDAQQLHATFERYNVDSVVHLAAQSHVDASFGNSLRFTDVNVRGTHVLLEVARLFKERLHRFVHVSTDEVYGSAENETHDETALLNPTNPYSASKAAAEMFVRSYHYSFGLPVLITRSNNIYGPRQYPEKVIPRFALRLLSGLAPQVHGDGQQRRSFLFATDVARAMRIVFERGLLSHTYNIGTSEEYTISDLARQMARVTGNDAVHAEHTGDDRPFNDRRYALNWSKVEALGWQPRVTFDDGLQRTVDWYRTIDADTYWPNQTWKQ